MLIDALEHVSCHIHAHPQRTVSPCCRWGLGVLAYVLLTGRQPFSSPKTDDPMVVMRRIVDDNWHIKYPPYLSPAAKVRRSLPPCWAMHGSAVQPVLLISLTSGCHWPRCVCSCLRRACLLPAASFDFVWAEMLPRTARLNVYEF